MTENDKHDPRREYREIVQKEVFATYRHAWQERERHLRGHAPLSSTRRRILILHDDGYLGRPGQQMEEMFRSRDDTVTLRWGLEGRDNPDPALYDVIVVALAQAPPSTVRMELHSLLDEARDWGGTLAAIGEGATLFREIGFARMEESGEDVVRVGDDLFLCTAPDHAADWVRLILDRLDERREQYDENETDGPNES